MIILGEPNKICKNISYDIVGKDVICLQTKNSRLGMSVMGQAYFSRELLKLYKSKFIRTVMLVSKNDSVLISICMERDIEVVVIGNK